MNHIERGALQQQRVLTFNDFLPMHQKGWDGWMHACCNVDGMFHYFFHCVFPLDVVENNMFSLVSVAEVKGMMLYSFKGLCINVNMLLHYVYLISLAAATLCPSLASHCSCINLSIFVSTYYAVKYEKRVFFAKQCGLSMCREKRM